VQPLILALLAVALVLLLLGLFSHATNLVVASVVLSLGVVFLISRRRKRIDASREPGRAATSRRRPPPAGSGARDVKPPAAATVPPLRAHGSAEVWVVDGRPRYHAPRCSAVAAREVIAIPLRQAVEDGFTPCAWCDPDQALPDRTRPAR
jgi:hypothetical protein